MAVNSPNSPRQKMINLMYLVFIAMLALNVSVEVLDGFSLVDDSLHDTSSTMQEQNNLIMNELESYNSQNREKAGSWYDKGVLVRTMSDSLTQYIAKLKLQMVRQADGKKADIAHIKHKEDLEAASVVMLSPVGGEGKKLKESLILYRETVAGLVTDSARRKIIQKSLSTVSRTGNKSWEASLFDNMPLAAALTLLTKIENDVRSAEGEALSSILNSVDAGDFRMNRLSARLIPESDVVIQGGTYNARVILAAEDSTHHPLLTLNGVLQPATVNSAFSLPANSTGTFPLEGYLEMAGRSGTSEQYPFSGSYTVVEPMATIAPTLMNVLYAGIDNEIAISVPGFAPQDINATISKGQLSRRGNKWSVRPATVGQDVTLSVSARTAGGTVRPLTSQQFRVRALPDPTPFLEYRDTNGNVVSRKGGSIPKAALLSSEGLKAAIDDGILHVPFQVRSFRTVSFDSMGNAIPEVSNGNRFSDRQREQIRRLARGSYFYISGVRAAGPDGTEREIAVMELRIN
ncbi:MAG: gliding motility protein GldM [Porphyromonadaceae bacterium]|nr:gliding motility protein GldM [Porphyromonadaceae bacterium]